MALAGRNRILLFALLGLGAVSLLFLVDRSRIAPAATPRGEVAPPTADPRQSDLLRPEAAPARTTGRPIESAPEEVPLTLVCRRLSDRSLLAGISLYVEGRPVAGPSGDDGALQVVRDGRQPLVLWAEGWRPVFVRAVEPTPAAVLFEPADAGLEVEVGGLRANEEIVRSLLQPHEFPATGESLWDPSLAPAGFDRLAARQLPPGTYDLYVWVQRRPEAPRVLSEKAVQLDSGRTTRVRLDSTTAPQHEPDG